jgi:hydroxypyruvate reductase
LLIASHEYRLDEIERIVLLGVGKAASAMTKAMAEMLADHSPSGLVITKHAQQSSINRIEFKTGGHPVPDEDSLAAGRMVLKLIMDLRQDDLLICLISGGGSALMTAPHQGISLADLQRFTATLLACGARIDEINSLRRRLDQLKGGGLARLAYPARVASLILSDVVGSPLEAIASGPTAPDPSTRFEALGVLERYGIRAKTPDAILAALEVGPETPKKGDRIFSRVHNVIVGSNLQAAQAALAQAQREGFSTRSLGNAWQGEARQVAGELCDILVHAPDERPFCLVAGGETTVTLCGRGKGGRNQELALAAVRQLAGAPDVLLISLASDGEDGPTDAAGAVVSGETLQHGLVLDLQPESFLDNNDAYSYFCALGDLLIPGPTGTNVNDLLFLFGF